jgi:type II secretory pathway pseudopilin PulG
MQTTLTQQDAQSMKVRAVASRDGISKEAGFNLIEAAIVLGIVGLIVGGIWAAAASAYENMRQQAASKNLLSLAQNIRGFYAQNPSDTIDTDTENLFSLGLLPADMVVGTAGSHTMRHQWGGTVTLTDTSTSGIASFSIYFNRMNSEACRNFIMRNANAARGSGLLSVGTDSGIVMDIGSNSSATTDITTVNSKCGNTTQRDVYFNFGLRG